MKSLSFLLAGMLTLPGLGQLPKLSTDFREVANRKEFLKSIPLTAAHKAMLRKNHFVQYPSPDLALYHVYGQNQYERIPSLLTADNALQIYHLYFDSTLRLLEEKTLLPEAETLTQIMLAKSRERLKQVAGTKLESAARKNLAYFSVAARLLDKNAAVDPTVEPLVAAEISKIAGHAGFDASAIFPYKVDYSQFIVRGHYTKSADLGRYFSTMMWYGLVPVSIAVRENKSLRPLPEQVRQACLLSMDLETSEAITHWKRLYEVTSLYAGKSNRLTPLEWGAYLRAKSASPDFIAELQKDATIARLIQSVESLRFPQIVTKKNDAATAEDIQVRFMGQREIPDSVIFNRLTDVDDRPMPNPLDVPAALGNERAASILDATPNFANPLHWTAYRTERKKVAYQFATVKPETWTQDLYWGWLDSLRAVSKMGKSAPAVFRTNAWQDHNLNSILASWTELRHDTILYGEQTVSEMGDGDEPQLVRGYVEPALPFYRRLRKLVDQTEAGLKGLGALSEDQASLFKNFREYLDFMITVSEKELQGQKLTRAEYDRIQYIEGELEGLNTSIQVVGQNFKQLTQDDLNMALVADVHTARGKALTVGVGIADDIVAIVPIEGRLTFVRGTAFSYYEFLQPISDRLTDAKWKEMLASGKAPARPFWTKSFFVNTPARPKEQ